MPAGCKSGHADWPMLCIPDPIAAELRCCPWCAHPQLLSPITHFLPPCEYKPPPPLRRPLSESKKRNIDGICHPIHSSLSLPLSFSRPCASIASFFSCLPIPIPLRILPP